MNTIHLLDIALVFMVLSIIPCIYRIIKGPTIPDRVIAVDALTTVIAVMLGVYSFVHESVFFMDVALVISIITFVGTVTIAKYLDEGVVF
ncbi:multisubunit sodium/proton antiporter MrpF subunit [Methanohalophilus euhalobius]|uniref:Multisubunit sodium/proton antiporter MrpF subunit n=1 Tax=Methanohalophilus euhalobius TaxID=51203 RepID=A0A285EQE5_9EURY|nr:MULTISPECIES: cation:proton antiporter [Methanohalophilus]RSD34481.1 MAG: multicomponent Na+:H+ antiporter subunit F [Methanohalophilus sp.]ODV49566.1 MAG: multicomponent Na+:H+ antiporter subunit F [Methanohalophilus sp. 2-GBenrich]RXG35042.1 multicomponent Na+:H+ antiporter subunit F [Methanohalophilus sp. WG1-DM]TCL11314.1 multisubunit sodium/proton antiporter MrpF subunit [Methanohalophilus euhalobius]SNY01250.1 multisubunit sodium/proton antiporter, MrpF subunit [Methanohalophilus euha